MQRSFMRDFAVRRRSGLPIELLLHGPVPDGEGLRPQAADLL